jgi:DNA replication protein DnaC
MSNGKQFLLESHLKQLRLPAMLTHYQTLAQDAARSNLSYEQFLLALTQEEVNQRERHSIERALRQAHFPVIKELAEFDFSAVPAVPKNRILELAQGGYLSKAEPILMLGNPGLGKTHVATGLAVAACRMGKRVRFYTAAGLVNELVAAQRDYRLSRFLSSALKQHLIVLDELGFIPFTESGAQLLFQFCSNLYERVALLITTNLHFVEWNRVMGGDEKLAAALLDRLTHRAHIIEFVGTSFRFREQLSLSSGQDRNREKGQEEPSNESEVDLESELEPKPDEETGETDRNQSNPGANC